jgi:hypothetical protein
MSASAEAAYRVDLELAAPDAPDGPPTEYELSACAHCEELLGQQHNLFDALEIGCLLGRNSAQVEMCWSIERERRAGRGMLR